MKGQLLADRYEVQRALGAGGAAETWLARDRETGGDVAVKVFDLGGAEDWKAVELFEREARVLAAIDHPAIPAYIATHPPDENGKALLVQALAPGVNLVEARRTRTFDEPGLRDLARQLLEVLDWLGSRTPPIVHRDIKPQNLILDDEGTVRLVDFGGVREAGSEGITVVGTFGYMAPEQAQGQADVRSDLYGLGMTLVFLLTGAEPGSLPQRRLKPDFRGAARASDQLLDFVDGLIEPVPDDRFDDAAAALAALEGDDEQALEDALEDALAGGAPAPDRAPPAPIARPTKTRVELRPREGGRRVAIIHPAPGLLRGQGVGHALVGTVGLALMGGTLMSCALVGASGWIFLVELAIMLGLAGLIHWLGGPLTAEVEDGVFRLYRLARRPLREGPASGIKIEHAGDYARLVQHGQVPLILHGLRGGDAAKLRQLLSG